MLAVHATQFVIAMVAWMSVAGVSTPQEAEYIPCGPPESAELEKALHWFLPVYAQAIAPRAEILQAATPKEKLAPDRISKIETWLDRILAPGLRPKSNEQVAMFDVPKLRWGRDFVVGYIGCDSCDAPDKNRAMEFQVDDTRIGLTFHSRSIALRPGGNMPEGGAFPVLSGFLNVPEDGIVPGSSHSYAAEVNGTWVRLGTVRYRLTGSEKSSPDGQRWWSYIPFCMMDGTIYVSISIIDWERGEHLPESAKDRWQEWEFPPRGPRESLELEKVLHRRLFRYEEGIAPRPEILQEAIPKAKLPRVYVSKVETWIRHVLRPEVSPESNEQIAMFGIPKLRQDFDYIVGYLPCASCDASDRTRAVEFQASDQSLSLTIYSPRVRVQDVDDLSVEQIVQLVSHFLAIPRNKLPSVTVEQQFTEVEGARLCCGVLKWEEDMSGQRLEDRKWWHHIPFWMMDGKLFVNVLTFDSELGDQPRAKKGSAWNLEGGRKMEEP